MATKKKLLQAAAGAAGGEALNVEDVFSTYLYEGNGSTQTITNGIDLDGEGGLVWTKRRDATGNHTLYDTVRGASGNDGLIANTNDAAVAGSMSSFNSDGFTLDSNFRSNASGDDMLSFTFRKAENFFTIVEWTGNGNSNQTIAHDLGVTPDLIITKNTAFGSGCITWWTPNRRRFLLNWEGRSDAASTYDEGSVTSRNDTNFYVSMQGGGYSAGRNGDTFVSYLFAGHDGDGTFGVDGDQDIVKIGQYTGNGSSSNGPEIDLGFEPQLLWIKNISDSQEPRMFNSMSGFGVDTSVAVRYTDNTAESTINVCTTSTGFKVKNASTGVNASGNQYAYFAIRRGPMAVPESATDVFAMDTLGGTLPNPPAFNSDFTVDAGLYRLKNSSSSWLLSARLTQGRRLATDSTASEAAESGQTFDYMNGYYNSTGVNSNYQSWMWKRAPNFCDVVAYTGDGSTQTINHNLGVAPEMMWVKMRSDPTFTRGWIVYHKDLGTDSNNVVLHLDTTAATEDGAYFNDERPTDTSFKVVGDAYVNRSGATYIAYLFASVDGVSKVGSYTGNGTSQTIDCGFTSGARFVLIKRTNGTGNWIVFDTARGIVSGTDPQLFLNTTDAEDTGHDLVDPASSGFVVNNDNTAFSYQEVNANGAEYIFYAIA